MMVIRETNRKTIDGKNIVQVKMNDKWETFFQNDIDGTLVEYDEDINSISFSYEKTEDDKRTVYREETRKHLELLNDGKVLGFHEYFDPRNDTNYKAIVVWNKSRGKWTPSLKKGVSLIDVDMQKLHNGMNAMGW